MEDNNKLVQTYIRASDKRDIISISTAEDKTQAAIVSAMVALYKETNKSEHG